ncbi:hypothetical protein ALC57_01443, partial [Trachymyrmex cornetzi]
ELLTRNKPFELAQIIYLPIIDAPPSDYDTIYTSLKVAVEKSAAVGQDFCMVTFDLPLFVKARDIVASCSEICGVKNVIVRLGGFHLVMSFLGCIGYIMAGSGIEDICSLVYAKGFIDKMLSGKAYARAIRCHSLIRLALALLVLKDIEFSDAENQILENVSLDENITEEILTDGQLNFLKQKFNQQLQELKENDPTAKLYVQYFEMVSLLFQFIHAERSGDWNMHLNSIRKMIPFFITAGHFNYAKNSYIYLQDMYTISTKLNQENYHSYTDKGCFTLWRSQQFYSGIWSDMTIEQTYMRNIHSREGLTHGRGVTPASTARWITSIPLQIVIAEQLETFCKFKMDGTSHQHKDAGVSRVQKDADDVKILLEWFEEHCPFVQSNDLISLSNGVIGSSEIDCHEAQEKGIALIPQVIKETYGNIKFPKKMKVLPLKSAFSKVSLGSDDVVVVDSETLFRRMLLCKRSDAEFEEYFDFELAPYPTLIFDGFNMRKNKKSDLYEFFTPVEDTSINNIHHVIDGGYLLHKIVRNTNETFAEI